MQRHSCRAPRVNLEPTPEQRELAAAARRFLAAELPVAALEMRAGDGAGSTGGAAAGPAWQKMAELGWFAIAVPVAHGGAGGSLADQALLFRELGRGLAPGPLLGTALGVSVAVLAGRDDLATAFMSGETTAALAVLASGDKSRGRQLGSSRIIAALA